jgi:hypothetical protein
VVALEFAFGLKTVAQQATEEIFVCKILTKEKGVVEAI